MTTALAKLNEQQNEFLKALQNDALVEVPKRERLRWCARAAGYSDKTTIADIIESIGEETVRKILERRLTRLSFDAVMVLEDALTGEVNPVETKIRVDVARDVLDRVIPKKEPKADARAPTINIYLPAKEAIKTIEHIADE